MSTNLVISEGILWPTSVNIFLVMVVVFFVCLFVFGCWFFFVYIFVCLFFNSKVLQGAVEVQKV